MHYEWNNAEKLSELLEKKNWEELGKEFEQSELIFKYKYSIKNYGSAFFMYKTLCKVLQDNEMYDTLKKVQTHAVNCFAKEWDVNSLQRIEASPMGLGALSDEAKAVLSEYEKIKERAMELGEEFFGEEKTVKEGLIEYRFKLNGKLSFIKNGMEYIVFYPWDN